VPGKLLRTPQARGITDRDGDWGLNSADSPQPTFFGVPIFYGPWFSIF